MYFAFPPQSGQYTANSWSKYLKYTAQESILSNSAITPSNCAQEDKRKIVLSIVKDAREFLKCSNVVMPGSTELEISHHYGLDKFYEYGLLLLTIINRDYCKKILITLPGQKHPEQYHNKKEETFLVLYGEFNLVLDGQSRVCYPGDVITIEPGTRHAFSSKTGAVIEEISTTHSKDDSHYTDKSITKNKNRKTTLTYWMG